MILLFASIALRVTATFAGVPAFIDVDPNCTATLLTTGFAVKFTVFVVFG
jgi:hypothetical protein